MRRNATALLLSLIFCLSLTLPARAGEAQVGPTGYLSTDKASYAADESVMVTMMAENYDSIPVYDLTLSFEIPEGYALLEGDSSSRTLDELASMESAELTATLVPISDGEEDGGEDGDQPEEPAPGGEGSGSGSSPEDEGGDSSSGGSGTSSDSSQKDDGRKDPDAVDTGDNSQSALWLTLLFLSALVLAPLFFLPRPYKGKRLMSLLLALAMSASLLPGLSRTASAAERKKYSFDLTYEFGAGDEIVTLRGAVSFFCESQAADTPDNPDQPDQPDEPAAPEIYVVTFHSNGGSDVTPQNIYSGGCAYDPEAPVRKGFVFAGWYSDPALEQAYDFSSPVTENLDLYADWSALDVVITLSAPGHESDLVNPTVVGSVTSNLDILSVCWQLESSDDLQQGELQLTDSSFSIQLHLRDGKNTLTLLVETADGSVTTKSLQLTYDSGESFDPAHERTLLRPTEQSEPAEGEQPSSESSVYYVANLLSVYFDDTISFEQSVSFLSQQLGGHVAGYLNTLDLVQIWLPDPLLVPEGMDYTGPTALDEITFSDLTAYGQALSDAYDQVELALPEIGLPSQVTLQATDTKDPWDNTGSNKTTSDAFDKGAWWVEYVDLDDAWDYSDEKNMDFFRLIHLGVVDEGFDQDHEDLTFKHVYGNDSASDHGTHVSGIMDAHVNNRKGIAGTTYGNGILLGYDCGLDAFGESINFGLTTGITKVIENGAIVVNVSMGLDTSYDWNGDMIRSNTANTARKMLNKLTDKGYDFVIVQAAGNEGRPYNVNGYFSSIDSDETSALSRVLIVSNIQPDGMLSIKSNGGPSSGGFNLIAAPGHEIYSTVINGYDELSGTSMAAPIVSGIAGLVWSVNPDLTGPQVVDILLDTASGTAQTNPDSHSAKGGMKIVNALNAVEKAISTLPTYYGYVTDATTGLPLEGAEVIVLNDGVDGMLMADTVYTDSEGKFTLPKLTTNTDGYLLVINAQGYTSSRFSFGPMTALRANGTINVGTIALNPALDETEYRIVLTWNDQVPDLDSHLVAETVSGQTVHLCYMTQSTFTQANLDVDDTDFFGPETITITNFSQLRNIRYAVHDFSSRTQSNSKAMAGSQATVEVYKGSQLLNRFTINPNAVGTEWDVFALDARGKVIAINSMTSREDPGSVLGSDYFASGVSVASMSAEKD
ncbi:MAG: S8 family serine peptidase [Oscillospiraceae bacterium]|nr:S8 family serine peptidase [Oscillospiraceae bacterium]